LSQASAGVTEEQQETRYSGREGESRASQKMKNSGNEAKKCLKIKDITFFDASNYVRLASKLATI
jgi:hypothetical protein